MHILLTRPLADCSDMILRFRALGHEVSHLPLINIIPVQYKEIKISDFNAIIFTSANSVKFLNFKNIDKKTICFCVGTATEKKARSMGFQKKEALPYIFHRRDLPLVRLRLSFAQIF